MLNLRQQKSMQVTNFMYVLANIYINLYYSFHFLECFWRGKKISKN